MFKRSTAILLWLGFSIQSLALKDSYGFPKFISKGFPSCVERDYPIISFYQVDKNFLDNPELNKAINAAAEISLNVLSNLIISYPSKSGRFEDNSKCRNFWNHNKIERPLIDAHFGLLITFSSNLEDELIETDKYEIESHTLIISVIINSKKFLTLEQASQAKTLSSALASIIFENNFNRNQLMKEVDDYLSSDPFSISSVITDSGCNPPINNCECCMYNQYECDGCYPGYYPNENSTQCCVKENCQTCNDGVNCDSCITNFYLREGECRYCGNMCATCAQTGCVQCEPGFILINNEECYQCAEGCEVCRLDENYNEICTQCFDSNNSILINNKRICKKENTHWNYNYCECNPGYYYDNNDEVCQLCNPGCEACITPTLCFRCFANFMNFNPDGSCSCNNGLTYNETTNECECPKFFYPEWGTGICLLCPNGCTECYDRTCLSCANDDLELIGDYCRCKDQTKGWDNTTQSCVQCLPGEYSYGLGCSSCKSGCKECVNSYNCTECYPGMNTQANSYGFDTCECDDPAKVFDPDTKTCINPDLAKNENSCGEECNISKLLIEIKAYSDSDNMVNRSGLWRCAMLNKKLSISKRKYNECTCIQNNTYYAWNTCSCYPGYYNNSGICQPCNVGCETCISPDNCARCFDNYLTAPNLDGSCSCKYNWLNYNTTTHACDCPQGKYVDKLTGICHPCRETCARCMKYNECDLCVSDKLKIDFLNQSCVNCPPKKFASRGECHVCDDICKECSHSSVDCTECYSGMHQSHFWYRETTCECDDPVKVFDWVKKTYINPYRRKFENEYCEGSYDYENNDNEYRADSFTCPN